MKIRKGQCNRCGYCCGKAQAFQTEEQKQYMLPCNHLIDLENGQTKCAVFGQEGMCNFDFPQSFEQLADGNGWVAPTCGFSFVEVED